MLGALRVEVDRPDEGGRRAVTEGGQVSATARIVPPAATLQRLSTATNEYPACRCFPLFRPIYDRTGSNMHTLCLTVLFGVTLETVSRTETVLGVPGAPKKVSRKEFC